MDYNTELNLNSIIYQIYNTDDFEEMKKTVATLIRGLIPCTCASILMTTGKDGDVFCDPITIPDSYEKIEHEYIKCQDADGSLWVVRKKQSTVFRDTDLMPEDKREQTEYYKRCFKPFGIHYSVDLTITNGQKIMGIMSLYRTKGEGDFTFDEICILKLLSIHLDARFAKELKKHDAKSDSFDISALTKKYSLTARESEVLELILNNCDNSEIEYRLCISPNTLKKHLQNLYRKANVSGRIQLAALMHSLLN
ncbi:MAG: LuxR C-terminal-related transcriptional regulator [Firmicutes bacterium]|nr:LuxR C-terminal-related transcriptional regulator [Bacillota bacterium]